MESLAGPLPGAEAFLSGGAPWWFGFHAVPGLAENVLQGHEADYLDFFLQAGTLGRGVSPEFRDAVLLAYSGKESLRCAFEHYRALPTSGAQILQAASVGRLTVPTMAVGAHPVGDSLRRQLEPITDDLVGHVIEGSGHIIPQDRSRELLALISARS